MDDSAHIAEYDAGDERPPAPQQKTGTDAVRAGRPAGDPQPAHQDDQRSRQQPRDLGTELAVEHPVPAGRATEHPPGTATASTATASTAGTSAAGHPPQVLGDTDRQLPTTPAPSAPAPIAEDPSKTVVAEGQLKKAVVGRTADVGPGTFRPQFHGRHEPTRGDKHTADADQEPHQPPADRGRGGHQVDKPERRHRQERLHHLRQESEADRGTGQRDPAVAPGLGRTHHAVGRYNKQQREQRIRVVESEHQDGHRRQGQHGTGNETRARTDPAADREIEDAHGCHALQRVR